MLRRAPGSQAAAVRDLQVLPCLFHWWGTWSEVGRRDPGWEPDPHCECGKKPGRGCLSGLDSAGGFQGVCRGAWRGNPDRIVSRSCVIICDKQGTPGSVHLVGACVQVRGCVPRATRRS